MIKAWISWCTCRVENILTLGKLLSLWFCFFLHSILFFKSQTSYSTYKIFSSYELARPVMGTIFLVILYRCFYATTPKNNSRDKTFVLVSEVSPTLCLHSAKFDGVEALLKVKKQILKISFSHYDLNDTGIGAAKNNDLKMEQCLKSYRST